MADYNEKQHPPVVDEQDTAQTAEPEAEAEAPPAEPAPGEMLPEEQSAESFADHLPVLPVRDVVIFNYMILPLFIGREKSVRAVEAALKKGRHILVCAQREEQEDEPGPDDLYSVGTVVQIMRMLKMPDSRVKVLVQGVSRARVRAWERTEPFMEAHVEPMHEIVPENDTTVEAMLRTAREQSEKVLSLRGISSADVLTVLQSVDDPGRLADLIAANMRMKIADAQRILETENPLQRLELVNIQLQHEVEVATVQARIQTSAREGMDKAQKDYYLREQLKAIRHELGESQPEGDDDLETLKKALDKAGLPREVRKEADKQLRRLAGMHADSSEANVVRTYLDWLVELPWKKLSRDRLDIIHAKQILDEDHCGLTKIKDRILEFLSVRKLNPQS
ncbi:MAG: LON peptidase substrate-binding domain-containing protein, partial [Desulfovibrionaceae bacterium]|nr:LON peptidase substrate-binding domain-containing protein [Desulfovibrionaceae bacterium]